MSRPPNLLLLLADDLRFDALGCTGHPLSRTPNLDRLAARGVRFANAFVTTAICVVSRASLFTGQWERRHRIVEFADQLRPAQWEQTYPARLRASGYRTGFVGKFGVGNDAAVAAMAPLFDFWRGLPGQAGASFFEDGKHASERFGDQAIEFLRTAGDERPFCLSVSFNAPHARDGAAREFAPDPRDEGLFAGTDFPVPALARSEDAFRRLPASVQRSEGRRRWQRRFADPALYQRTVRDYFRLIAGLDREVGRIEAELAARGLHENTVLVFTSDNGFSLGERGLADKWFAYEEDIRIPLLAAGPGIRPGGLVDALALNVDLAPTLLQLAGLRPPRAMQGQSLLPFLQGRRPPRGRREFFYEHHSVASRIPPCEAVRTARQKYIRWVGADPPAEELYDLENDLWEERNLAADPRHRRTLARLRTRWETLRQELS